MRVLSSLTRMFFVFKGFRGRLLVSQLLLLISALASVGVATLTQRLVNDGLVAGDVNVIVNKIMVVNAGEIVEYDDHENLMAAKGFYYNLYMSQFKGKGPGGEVDTSGFVST